MLELASLSATLKAHGYDYNLRQEDGIPYLEIWQTEGVLSLAAALQIAEWTGTALRGPVHFHQMTGTSVAFFVFDPSRSYSAVQTEEYGTPLGEWVAGVQKRPEPEPFTLHGHFNDGDILPTQATNRWGFIWERPDGFFSTDETGKWCVVRNATDIDELWAQVRQAVRDGKFQAALVSSPRQAASHGGTYVICAFTRNWQDKADVDAAREVLRGFGVTEELGYKRDVDTINGVYGVPEEWTYRG